MLFWNWFFIFAIAKFLWLLLILFLPILGMLIYFLARPSDAEIARRITA